MTLVFRFALTACCVAVLATVPGPGHAQSPVCTQLEARLISLERGVGNRSRQDYREYDHAIRRQQTEIDRASAEARRSHCRGGFFLQPGKPAPKCGRLMATIDQMKANLRRLREAQNRHRTDPFSISRERNGILRSMSANRCRSSQARIRTAPRGTGLFAALFGATRTRTFGEDTFFRDTGFGTYRTLCVRTCDGYYFPISFSTVPGQFTNDEHTCRARCPGTDVALFTHRNPGQESDAMVSLAGQPYSTLPTAFKYRSEYNPSCGCGSGQTVTASLGAAFDLRQHRLAEPLIALPKARPILSEDPETLANRAGGFAILRSRQEPTAILAELPAAREVRIVGPSFYYGQQTEIGMLIPSKKPSLREEELSASETPVKP